jgi:hypothetical protein
MRFFIFIVLLLFISCRPDYSGKTKLDRIDSVSGLECATVYIGRDSFYVAEMPIEILPSYDEIYRDSNVILVPDIPTYCVRYEGEVPIGGMQWVGLDIKDRQEPGVLYYPAYINDSIVYWELDSNKQNIIKSYIQWLRWKPLDNEVIITNGYEWNKYGLN